MEGVRAGLLFVPILALFCLMAISAAVSFPSGTAAYLPVNIINGQGLATNGVLQIPLTVNSLAYQSYESQNDLNTEFFYANGTAINAWIESNNINSSTATSWWLRLTNSISANSNQIIYMGFLSHASAAANTGEYYILSSTNQCSLDNGNVVFNFYDGFCGGSLNPQWSSYNAPSNIVVSNGITINANKNPIGMISNPEFNAINQSVDVYWNVQGEFGANIITANALGFGYANTINGAIAPIQTTNALYVESDSNLNLGNVLWTTANTLSSTHFDPDQQIPQSGNWVFSLWSNTIQSFFANSIYGNVLLGTTFVTSGSNHQFIQGLPASVFFYNNWNTKQSVNSIIVYYVRVRYTPPLDVFPTYSFGSLQTLIEPTLTYSNGNSISVGQTDTITANCMNNLATDNCAIWYTGTQLANAIGSVTYNAGLLGGGTYAIYANDLTSGVSNSVNTLVVTGATPTLTLTLPASNTMVYNGANSGTITANIQTTNNQLTGNVYVNGVLQWGTTTHNTFTVGASAGTYTIVFNTLGNANYIAMSVSNSFVISQATPLITLPSFPASHGYTGTPDTLTANIQTLYNQVTANDYVNSILITSFTTQNTVQEVGIATYTMVANTFGNGNYLSGTNSMTYTISGVPTLSYSSGSVINIGSTDTVTATCTPSTDNCAIWYGSTQLANGIGSTTYNAGLLNSGQYLIYANDLTTSQAGSINTLSVMPLYPNERWGGGMVYDAADGYYLMFSGSSGQADTWIYYPSNGLWNQVTTSASNPVARTNACMAYDPKDGYTVLFGGVEGGQHANPYLNDTWTYLAGTWTNITTQSGFMPNIADTRCSWDSATNQIIMFGGYTQIGNGNTLNQNGGETWAFSGGTWTQLTPANSPQGRFMDALAYDSKDGYMVLYGGIRGVAYLNDTWEYNGVSWKNITLTSYASGSTTTPPDRWEALMTNYSNGVILFGGQLNALKNNGTVSGHSSQNQTWQFVNGQWYNLTPSSPSLANPPTRFDPQGAFNPITNTLLVFAGLQATAVNSPLDDDLWSYYNGNWIPITNSIVFKETGLTPPKSWSITLGGKTSVTSYNVTNVFNRPNNNYTFVVNKVVGYTSSPVSGIADVNGSIIINVVYTGVPVPTLSYSNGNMTLVGHTDTITANCMDYAVTDNCAIWYSSTQLANAIGSVTYNAGLLSAGTYGIYANDLTSGQPSSVNTLTVSAVITPPLGVGSYVPVTLTNQEPIATNSVLQVPIVANSVVYSAYEESSLNNTVFFFANGTVMQSWLENNNSKTSTGSEWWVRLTSSIPASSSLTIYMGWYGISENFGVANTGEYYALSPGNNIALDDGANVFNFYDGFAGGTLSSLWTSTGAANIVVSNGLTIKKSLLTSGIQSIAAFNAINQSFDVYWNVQSAGNSITANSIAMGYNALPSSLASTNALYIVSDGNANPANVAVISANAIGSTRILSPVLPQTGNQVFSIWSNTINSFIGNSLYGNVSRGMITVVNTGQHPFTNGLLTQIGLVNDYTNRITTNTLQVYFVRLRYTPPLNVLPSVSFGNALSLTPSLSYSNGNSISYGQTDTITASCTASNTLDNCAIWYGSTQLANGIGSATYNAGLLTAGTYGIYANDITTGVVNSVNTLTISQLTPLIWFSVEPASYVYNGVGGYFVANIVTSGSQVTANDYINGALIASFTTSNSYTTSSSPGTYTVVANTFGNANYIAASNSFSFTISAMTPTLTFSNGNSITYASTDTMSASCSAPDSCALEKNGVVLASGTGSASYNAGLIGAGTYSISANDLSVGANSLANVLVISKATPSLSISCPSTYTYNAVSLPVSATFTPVGSDPATANIFSGSTVYNAAFTGTNTVYIAVAGAYTFNTAVASDANYIANSQTCSYSISQATPLIWFPNFPASHAFTGTPDTLTANIQTINNQVTANDYINGALIASFNTQNTVQEVSVGTYTMVANSAATANYLAGSNSMSYTISMGGVFTLEYSNGNNIVYGTPDTITGICPVSTDNCALWYSGTQLTNGIGSATYNAGLLGVGTYGIYANDLTQSTNSVTNTLVITQATPLITFPGFPSSHVYTGTPDTLTASIQTINNQVTASDYINGALIASFNTQNTVQEVSVGTYTMVANSAATANYVAGTNSIAYTISSQTTTTTVVSGGGGGPTTFSDNISTSQNSAQPVFTIYTTNGTQQIYQNQLPYQISLHEPANFSFACSVVIGSSTYHATGTVYGIGVGIPCGSELGTYSKSVEATYTLQPTTTTTTSTTTTIPTTSTTITTTVPITTNAIVSVVAQRPTTVNFTRLGVIFTLLSHINTTARVNVSNATASSSAPNGYQKLIVVNFTIVTTPNVSEEVALHYPCSLTNTSSIAPYILRNGTWAPVQYYAMQYSSCSVLFSVPGSATVGLFIKTLAPTTTTTVQQISSQQPQTVFEAAVVVVVAIIIIALALWARRKRV